MLQQILKKSSYFFCVFFPCLVIWTTLVSAHTEGASFEAVIDGYLIDIGYKPQVLTVHELTRFDFALSSDTVEAEYTDVWVVIEKNENIYFSGGIQKSTFGPTGLSIILPDPGIYTVSVRFQNNGLLVVATDFPIEIAVAESVVIESIGTNILLVVTLLLGIGIGHLLRLYTKPSLSS